MFASNQRCNIPAVSVESVAILTCSLRNPLTSSTVIPVGLNKSHHYRRAKCPFGPNR